MIRFCDKEVYGITEGNLKRMEILDFFLKKKENIFSVIAVYDKDGKFKGIITYAGLLMHAELKDCINTDTITISEDFWEKAKSYFRIHPKELLTIMSKEGNIQGFAYDDITRYDEIESSLYALENGKFFMPEKYKRIKMVVITDLNELAWRCYNIFYKKGYVVCVIGEKWEWFGLKSGERYLEFPDYAKLYIYAEGTELIREERVFAKSYYREVSSFFRFVYEIALENMKSVYADEIGRIRDKVAVCECYVPNVIDESKRTIEEKRSAELGCEMADYVSGGVEYTDEMEQCIWNIYGKEEALAVKEYGNEVYYENIPLGEVKGKSICGIKHEKRIYLIGPCIASGYGCLAKDSLCGQLQKLVDAFKYRVISIAFGNFDEWRKCMCKLPLRKKDIVLIINVDSWFPQREKLCDRVDLKAVYENTNRNTMFCNYVLHTNPEGNRLIAKEILQRYLEAKIYELSEAEENPYLQKGELLNEEAICEVQSYVAEIKKAGSGKAGAIVMNCNPFTYGHRYLIEYAAARVDLLYIFVVEEDKSFIKFKDRFLMVHKGTEDIGNVVVVPSGKWVLSYKTFAAYFEKEEVQKVEVDARLDLEIFARYIAPQLGITKRFVGQEPFDKVTKQYNEQMKEVLNLFNIEVEEIPRLQLQGEIISASLARRCLKEGKLEMLKKCVPEMSYLVCLKYKETS